MLLGFDCKINCWECPRDCFVKDIFPLPEPIFNKIVMDSLKTTAGYAITVGKKKEVVEEKLKITAVSLYIARKEYLKKNT